MSLTVVEIQQTFYRLPRPQTAARWRAEAPSDFQFTLKAFQGITHPASSPTYRRSGLPVPIPDSYGFFRPTPEVQAAWEATREIALLLQARIVVLQCPVSFGPTPEHKADLRSFCRAIERGGLLLAWEPRGNWTDEEISTLCRELDLIHCVDPFQRLPVHGTPAYLRLHGRTGYPYRYSDDDLRQLAAWCQSYADAYCMFNNMSMWEDALRFQSLLRGRSSGPRHTP